MFSAAPSGAGCSFPKGEKSFYKLNGELVTSEQLYPNYDGVLSIGGTIVIPFLCISITAEVGFDCEYYLDKTIFS